MKACIIQNTTFNENLGVSTYLRNITKTLSDKKDIELYVIVQKQSQTFNNHFSSKLRIFEIEGDSYSLLGNIRFMINAFPIIRMLIKKKKVHIFHTIYPFSSLIIVFFSIFLSRISRKPRIVYDLRSPWPETGFSRKKMNRLIEKTLLILVYKIESLFTKRIGGIIFITEKLSNTYHKKMNFPEKEVIIPSGFDNNIFFYSKEFDKTLLKDYVLPSDKVFGYLGAMNTPRELSFVIKAFSKLKTEIKNTKLVFIGDGTDMDNLKNIRNELKLEKSVFFLGSVKSSKASQFIRSFDICICHLPPIPMFEGSFPLKILEYFACGRVVLATDIVPHEGIVKPNFNGYRYCPYSIQDFVNTAIKCLQFDSEVRRRKISESIIDYSWNNLANKVFEFYIEILKY